MKDNITLLDFGMAKVNRIQRWIHDARLQCVCAWCKRELKAPLIPRWLLKPVLSHGICPDCARGVLERL